MKKCFCLLMFLILFSCFSITVKAKEVDVILFTGQSNMTAAGVAEQFNIGDTLLISNYNNADFSKLNGKIYEYKQLTDSLVEYTSSNNIPDTIGEYINLCEDNNECLVSQERPYAFVTKFTERYVELTGHNVVMVPIAVGGRGIAWFNPEYTVAEANINSENNYYSHIKNKIISALNYLENNGYTINNKFYIIYNGEYDNHMDEERYTNLFNTFHNNIIEAAGLDFGAIVKPSYYYDETRQNLMQEYTVGTYQDKLIEQKDNLVLASEKTLELSTLANIGYYYYDNVHFKFHGLKEIGIDAANNVVQNKNLYKKYTIKYDCNSGAGTMEDSVHYYNQEKSLNTNSCIKTGYTFKGWATNKIAVDAKYSNGEKVKNLVQNDNGNLTLYALWAPNSYIVSFDTDTTTKQVVYETVYGNLPTPVKKGHSFVGWYLEDTFENLITKDTKVTMLKHHKLYSKWNVLSYMLKLDLQGGTTSDNVVSNVKYNETVQVAIPTKTGYRFKNWTLTGEESKLVDSNFTMGISDTILKANWELIKPDITKTSDYKVKNGMVSNIKLNSEIKDLNFDLENYYTVKVQDKDKKNKTTGKIVTNDKVQIYLDNTLVDEYVVVVKGDVTGTGSSTVADVAKLYQALKGKIEIEDCYKEAGNVVDTDNEIKINDVAKLYQFIKGKIKTLD